MKNKDLPAMPIRLRKDWSKAKIGHCECGHHGSIVDGLCADCHDVEYQQEREQVLIDRIIELQSQGDGLTKREMFAMNAPDMPISWLATFLYTAEEEELMIKECWHTEKCESARYVRALVAWRWHYADMMLEGEK